MDWYDLAKSAALLVAANGLYWLLLVLAIAVWLRERRRRRLAAPGARRTGMSLIGALGGTAVARFANSVVMTFGGPQGFAKDISSSLLFEFTQSVFQRDVLLEPLIQSGW